MILFTKQLNMVHYLLIFQINQNYDENAASPFICRVVELEQEKLDLQGKNARIVVGKDGKVYEQ